MKNILIPSFLTLAFVILVASIITKYKEYPSYHAQAPLTVLSPKHKTPKWQRIRDAYQLEFEKTKDPATNTVPKERLFAAKRIADQKRAALQERTAIPGITWDERGPDNVGGRTRAIMVDMDYVSTVWAGSVSGGLWKSTDGGTNWTKIDDTFDNLAITAIAQNPSNHQIIYFGTGEGFGNFDSVKGMGLWKSTDGGNTWTHLASTSGWSFHYCTNIKISGTGDVFVSTRNDGVQKSTDGGSTWNSVLAGNANDIDIATNGDIYAGIRSDGIYKSTDGGTNWTALSTGLPNNNFRRIELACAPSDSNVVYALYQDSDNTAKGIYKTTNGGTNWSTMTMATDHEGENFASSQAWYDLIVAVDPNDPDRAFIGGLDLYATTDGGSNWEQISHWYGGYGEQYVHADQHAIVFAPGSSDVVYFGNDGGIFKTTNGTATTPTITESHDDYNVTQYYACTMTPDANTTLFYAGSQDNGTQEYVNPGINSTTEVSGGDGGFCHISQNNADIRVTAYIYNYYWVTDDNWATWDQLEIGSEAGKFINPTDYDENANILYGSYDSGAYSFVKGVGSTNTTGSQSLSALGDDEISAVTTSSATDNRVFFGTDGGRIVRTDNANTTSPNGTLLFTHPHGAYVSCIAIAPGNNDNHLLATFSNYGVTSIYETIDGGSNWTAVEGNLPDMPVRWGIFHPNNDDMAIIATELGVWSTDNLDGAGTDWAPTNGGLANVRTDMIQYRTSDNLMIAATHGRGLFSSSSIPLPVEMVSFNGKATDEGNKLTWKTASEAQNDYFRVQRSLDGKSFENIGKITGRGNSTGINQYTFLDEMPAAGMNYYRLQQMDLDGTAHNTKIVAVHTKNNTRLTISPNPVNNATLRFTIDIERSTGGVISIMDLTGKQVFSEKVNFEKGYNRKSVDLTQLPAGIYYLVVQKGNRKMQSKFVLD